MKTATVTYRAPKGDSKVVEMLGHTFFDGQATEVVCEDANMQRLQGNQHFEVGAVSDHDPDKAAASKPKEQPDKAREPDKPDKGDVGKRHQ